MGLFWYPALNSKFDFDKPIDKGAALDAYIKYYLDRLQSMFKYDGLPDSIPQKWLEHYLLVNGSCIFCMDGDDLIVTTGGWGGMPDRYYIPTEYIVANPYVKESTRKTYTIDEDCVLIRNDVYATGIMPMLIRYCSQLVENDITMNIADILARATLTITALSGRDRESVEQWLKRIRHGELAAIGELPAMIGNQDRNVNIQPFQSTASTLTDLIEYHQYLKAGLFNELGLNSNYNMKRESINSNESQLNDDMLHPLIDDMLAMRREALEKVNEMFGTNITVNFNSAWKDNEIENKVAIDSMQAAAEGAEAMTNETDNIEAASDEKETLIDEPENEENKEEVTGDEAEPIEETAEVSEEVTTTQAIEELTDAVIDLTDVLEGDQVPDEEDEKEGDA
jgi:hypothetical protein